MTDKNDAELMPDEAAQPVFKAGMVKPAPVPAKPYDALEWAEGVTTYRCIACPFAHEDELLVVEHVRAAHGVNVDNLP